MSPATLLALLLTQMEAILKRDPTRSDHLRHVAQQAADQAAAEAVEGMDRAALYGWIEEQLGVTIQKLEVSQLPEQLAKAIGMLDAWHAFANPDVSAFQTSMPIDDARLAIGLLATHNRYNDNDPAKFGHLIPLRCPGVPGPWLDGPLRPAPLSEQYQDYLTAHNGSHSDLPGAADPAATRLLKNLIWLPPTITCGHPDSTLGIPRTIKTGYLQVGLRNQLHGSARKSQGVTSAPLKIAVAPLAETHHCAALIAVDEGRRYLVEPTFSIERVKAAIERAFAEGVTLLLLPEMTVNKDWLSELSSFVRQSRRQHRNSPLEYILIGVTAAPKDDAIQGENFVAFIDGDGQRVCIDGSGAHAKQDKINRWNLRLNDQRRFGFDRGRPPKPVLAATVAEAIQEADTAYVFDVARFGRIIIMICASFEHNEPSDWLVQHARPDWIYSPVMDSSTCYTGTTSPLEKWTIKRAVRAACFSRAKVIVANSMALQGMENLERSFATLPNSTPKQPSSHVDNLTPGISFMIDATGSDLQHRVLTARIPSAADDSKPIVAVEIWNSGWTKLSEKLP